MNHLQHLHEYTVSILIFIQYCKIAYTELFLVELLRENTQIFLFHTIDLRKVLKSFHLFRAGPVSREPLGCAVPPAPRV